MKRERILAAVMSFNRGASLLNAVDSIEKYLPGASILICDDGSDCPETRSILSRLEQGHTVLSNDRTKAGGGHLGGLHANMNRALGYAAEHDFPYLYIIQDDIQFVRLCDDDFLSSCDTLFADSRIAHIGTMFFKGFLSRERYLERYLLDEEFGCYRDRVLGLDDVGLVDVRKLVKAGFRYAETESASGMRARELGFTSVVHHDPVMMYTAWPRTFRPFGWKFGIFARLNEWGVHAGCNPFREMTPAAIRALKERGLSDLPFAETFLETVRPLRRPWWYSTCYDPRKLKQPKYLFRLSWINDGPVDYIEFVDAMPRSARPR